MMLSLLIGGVFTQLSTSTVNIAIPNFMEIFHADLDLVRWTITGFMLSTGIIAPITAYFGERFSYKRMYLVAITGFLLSSIGCAVSANISMLIFFRILQGVFNGLAMPTSMSIIYQILPREKQAFAMSLISFALTTAPAIGPTLSGWLIEYYGWKSIFLFNVPFGIITIAIVLRSVPFYKLNPPESFNLTGFMTSIFSTTLLLVAFSNFSRWGWKSIQFLSMAAMGTGALVFFIFHQLKAKNPILNLGIFRNRIFSVTILLRGIITMGLYAGSLLTPLFLQTAQGASALQAGLVMLPASVAMAFTTIIIGKIYNKTNPVLIIQTGIIIMAVGSFLLSRSTLETTHMYITICLAFRNIGIALALSTASMYGMAVLEPEVAGNGSAVNNWVAQSIGCFSIGVFTSLLSSKTIHYQTILPESFFRNARAIIHSIDDVYLISAFIILFGFVISFLFYNIRKKSDKAITCSKYAR